MNCPICNFTILKRGSVIQYHHAHRTGVYVIYYDDDSDLDGGCITSVHDHKNESHTPLILKLNGFVFLDESKIEKLLLLK